MPTWDAIMEQFKKTPSKCCILFTRQDQGYLIGLCSSLAATPSHLTNDISVISFSVVGGYLALRWMSTCCDGKVLCRRPPCLPLVFA